MYKAKLVSEGWSLCSLSCLSSYIYRYIVNKKSDFSQLTKPIYCSNEKTRKFQDWANIWTSYLSSKVNQSLVLKGKSVSLTL